MIMIRPHTYLPTDISEQYSPTLESTKVNNKGIFLQGLLPDYSEVL